MATQRVLRSVTRNFLATYTSRYSDREGYWLFGFLSDAPQLEIDLLGDRYRRSDDPSEDARLFAMDAFVDQLTKAKMAEARLRSARLSISTSPQKTERVAGGTLRQGREMTFVVAVTTNTGATYEARCTQFVAPHDPSLELRSTRADPRPPQV
jgi:hypothetical protein